MGRGREGDLTLSGFLYVGSDYQEWKKRVDAILRLNGLWCWTYEWAGIGFKSPQGAKALQLVQSQLSSEITDKLPEISHDWAPKQLFEVLERHAAPFRLFDLPAELRNRVYGHVVKDAPTQRMGHERTSLPPLLHSSAEIRRESNPIYFSEADFLVVIYEEEVDQPRTPMQEALSPWLTSVVRDRGSHLRKVGYIVESAEGWCHERRLQISYSIKDGLQLKLGNQMEDVSDYRPAGKYKEMLLDHTKQVRQTISLARLAITGESIIMALVANPKLWNYDKLEDGDGSWVEIGDDPEGDDE